MAEAPPSGRLLLLAGPILRASRETYREVDEVMGEKPCETCGNLFIGRSYRPSKYCSRRCSNARNNHKRVYRVCQNCAAVYYAYPSQNHFYCSWKCYTEFHRGKNHHRYGKPGSFSGESHPQWKGGVTPANEKARKSTAYRDWREEIFARDNWTCQECGVRGGHLHAHHVFSFAQFPEHRFEVWNGITLCKECHASIHPNLKPAVAKGG